MLGHADPFDEGQLLLVVGFILYRVRGLKVNSPNNPSWILFS